ncbi:hypothetical protein LTR78_005353 [Recurvomyces mirabilis]|uniref:Uncharacterized protein n=1 Tax=Recurvomyces mirabilis TaxID=574656 RepID=A0AAE0WMT3_9PEZI|nr:hypothetical protein LTR78_005353 [Recurvomyces mirabilis]KAK5152740.1 hypothetical protein LTS14_008274 [Recurvomyces mirabilis]
MASHMVHDENQTTYGNGKPSVLPPTIVPPRQALGDRSPNIKSAQDVAPIAALLKKKPMASSPLKRSFTAMVENEGGFTYLKSRRLSGDKVLSDVATSRNSTHSVFQAGSAETGEATRFRPVEEAAFQKVDLDTADVPVIQELSPTEPNTPSDDGEVGQHSSGDRKSFSSLINYDPSSQTSHLTMRPTSKSEMLKLRLRVAIYKVRTNQIDIPFHQLKVESSLKEVRASSKAVEEAVAELRREAQARMPSQGLPVPKLLPAPVLLPTACSSRMIYGPALPSSPPDLLPTDRLRSADDELSGCDHRYYRDHPRSPERRLHQDEAELTSSVVKGRVAEGLIGLRNAL